MNETELKLLKSFPKSFINNNGEFIGDKLSTGYFSLKGNLTDLEIKCKVLEWLSRAAFKSQPYRLEKYNQKVHEFYLKGINDFLGTSFTESEMELIYTKLGNNIRRQLCIEFVESGFKMEVLR